MLLRYDFTGDPLVPARIHGASPPGREVAAAPVPDPESSAGDGLKEAHSGSATQGVPA